MAVTRSILKGDKASTVQFWYGKRDPATGAYFDDTEVTAASLTVYDSSGSVLVGPASMSYVANLRGYTYDWSVTTELDSVDIAYAYVTPTRDSAVAAALAGDEIVPIDVSDVESAVATAQSTLTTEIDANESKIDSLQSDFNAFEVTNQTEHDTTQSKIDAVQATVDDVDSNVDLELQG